MAWSLRPLTTMLYATLNRDKGRWEITLPVRGVYTIHEVQRLLGLSSTATVYRMIERGELSGPCSPAYGQCVTHASLVQLVERRGPVLAYEQARKALVAMIERQLHGQEDQDNGARG